MPLHIRFAHEQDVPAVVAVVNAAFSVEEFLEGNRTDQESIREMMAKGTFLVGEEQDGRIVASVYTEMRGERSYFGMLAVNPALQGSGLGRRMIEAAEDRCRKLGAKHMDIVVLSLRPDLPPLYRKLGYVETGTIEFKPTRRLKDGFECHAITMSKPL